MKVEPGHCSCVLMSRAHVLLLRCRVGRSCEQLKSGEEGYTHAPRGQQKHQMLSNRKANLHFISYTALPGHCFVHEFFRKFLVCSQTSSIAFLTLLGCS